MGMRLHLSIQPVLEPLLDLMFQEYGNICFDFVSKVKAEVEAVIIHTEKWTKNKRYLYYEHRTPLPRERSTSVMKWSYAIMGYPGAKESLSDFNKLFYTVLNGKETLETLQAITDACQGKASRQSDVVDLQIYISVPIPYCTSCKLNLSPKTSTAATTTYVW